MFQHGEKSEDESSDAYGLVAENTLKKKERKKCWDNKHHRSRAKNSNLNVSSLRAALDRKEECFGRSVGFF